MRDFWFRRLRRKNGDDGLAMAMVVGIGAVMILLVTSVTSVAISGITKATNDQDWAGAISAAYAGIGDYQSRLANDYSYVQYGNPAALFGKDVPGNSVTLPPTAFANPAFGVGPTGTWASIAGSNDTVGGANRAFYRYEVDNSKYSSTGILRLRSTGKVGNVTRTIVADLKQQGFIDFLYFTDYEMLDPDINSSTGCTVAHAWELSSARPSNCVIQFVKADEIKGPLHSNDTLDICGGKFDQTVTSSNTTLKNGVRYTTIGCSPTYTPTDGVGAPLSVGYAKPIGMPATNSKMIQETRTDLPQTVQRPGCLYTGPTTIKFNSDGTMTVRSPWTKKTQIVGDPPTGGSAPADCGTPGDPNKSLSANANTLSGANGQTITITNKILDHNLVYVQGVVKTVSTDPNYWASNKSPNNNSFKCVGQTSTDAGNGLDFPRTNEDVPNDTAMGKSYDCQAGDVFVQGTVDAAITVAASHYVYVTGDLVREDPQDDILGLVGTGAVWVWNPVDSSGKSLLNNNGRKIEAAILSVAHAFQVQNYTTGGYRGQLQVTGAIAQKFRGTVGTGNGTTGYTKQYVYDPRLRNIAPPKFLSPVSTTYGVNVLVEVKTAFSPDGTPIP
ncbi:hypothetical protein [Leifsonia sp. NPDC058230]|uniref:hypothetical protein n=1 Tax=Leifsonia sp. NPDC058230 TaxID=3346391 RepID=UPI0036DB7190